MRDENGRATGIVMAGAVSALLPSDGAAVLLSYLLITLFALGIGSLLSDAVFRAGQSGNCWAIEPDAFRQLFLQRMDILDALDEGLMAIDEHSMITYEPCGGGYPQNQR